MTGNEVARDGAEILLAVAVGGMLWAATARLRRGQARPVLCPGCHRSVARVYAACPYCGRALTGHRPTGPPESGSA